VLRTFLIKREEVAGDWKKLCNELHNLYLSLDFRIKSVIMRWAGYVACKGKMRNVFKVMAGKPARKGRLLGRPGGR
jgi:hypothetical protein